MSGTTNNAAGGPKGDDGAGAATGRSIIAGEEWGGELKDDGTSAHAFRATDPRTGEAVAPVFACAGACWVDAAARAAAVAFQTYRRLTGDERARLLEAAAGELDRVHDELIGRASVETGLSGARLEMEFVRTTRTLRMFAGVIRDSAWMRPAIDPPAPGAAAGTIAGHDLRRIFLPLGPVAVFGASNFPLAYGVAGGDTASALAAGCPVIVKGHPSHPGTGEIAARAIARGVEACGIDAGVFSYLHSGGAQEMEVGQALVGHPLVAAVGFTGSFGGGTALARAAASRREPIPVFAEMGSANPIYVLPGAARERTGEIVEQLAASILDSSGQQCTCPGIVFIVGDDAGSAVVRGLSEALEAARSNVMLSRRVRAGYHARVAKCLGTPGVECTPSLEGFARAELSDVGPVLAPAGALRVDFGTFKDTEVLREEIFGPGVLVVTCADAEQVVEASRVVLGSLAAGIYASAADAAGVHRLLDRVQQKTGRVVFNGVTTGVRVSEAMTHGGPHPATNRPETTAVGPLAMERWMRPVCFQNAPSGFLPGVLCDG